MALEDALELLGAWGKYQIIAYFAVGTTHGVVTGWILQSLVFVGYINPHFCVNNTVANETLTSSPIVTQTVVNISSSQCTKTINYTYLGDNALLVDASKSDVKCDKWTYAREGFQERGTILMEWDLVCDKDEYVALSQTIFSIGVVVGYILLAPMADLIGRKKTFFICQLAAAVFGILISQSVNFSMFSAMYFFMGALAANMVNIGIVIQCELFTSRVRQIVAPFDSLFLKFGVMTLLLFAYYMRNWRHLTLITSCLSLLFLLYYYWCPESLHWLIAQKRFEEADKILEKAAKFNKVKQIPKEVIREEENVAKTKTGGSFVKYLTTPKTLLYTVIVTILMFANNLMSYGITLNIGNLPGNIFVNIVLMSVSTLPSIPLAIWTMRCLGRRWPFCIISLLTGLAMTITTFLLAFRERLIAQGSISEQAIDAINTTLAFFALMLQSTIFDVENIYAQEILPTNIRSTGLGLFAGASFVGTIIAPFSVYFYRQNPWAVTAVFAAITTFSGLLSPLLVETIGRPFPDTLEEVLSWPRAMPKEVRKKLLKAKNDDEKRKKKEQKEKERQIKDKTFDAENKNEKRIYYINDVTNDDLSHNTKL